MPTTPAPTSTDARILDAALTLFAEVGIKRTTIDDIAREAGVNRATLFRRMGSKDAIVRAALLREAAHVLDSIGQSVDPIEDDRERVIAGFVTTLVSLRTNTILVKALAVDAAETYVALTRDAGAIIDYAASFVADRILVAVPQRRDAHLIAAIIARLLHSLVMTPEAAPRLNTEVEMRDFARQQLVPLILNG
ncbi:TetR/AcrR family transcriptional regulator [Smaragdicoccus niigatensis]|uniref:TetR/AcrR family transcriptional regulator n=1 Tax=Smaragdicoccus niigatensis TaxID=359359 RepID=UPI00037D7EDD|nr:TetR/AcrR family transcriptional regulator [Smaragdicoccus niigatensis]